MVKPAKGGVFGAALGLEEGPGAAEDDDAEADEGEALTAAADEVRAAMSADDSERFRDGLERFVRLCKGSY
jgi:hypothetical protein